MLIHWMAVIWVKKKHVYCELFHALMQEKFYNGTSEDRTDLLPSHLVFLMLFYNSLWETADFRFV